VTEAGEGELELAEGSYDVARGDVSEITVELNEVTEGTVVIGNEEDDNYQANISIVDDDEDGEVVLNFNTFTAGDTNTSVDVVTAEGDDEATLVNQDSTAQGSQHPPRHGRLRYLRELDRPRRRGRDGCTRG